MACLFGYCVRILSYDLKRTRIFIFDYRVYPHLSLPRADHSERIWYLDRYPVDYVGRLSSMLSSGLSREVV